MIAKYSFFDIRWPDSVPPHQVLRVIDIRSSMIPGCLTRHVAFAVVEPTGETIDYSGVIPYKMMEKLIEHRILLPK